MKTQVAAWLALSAMACPAAAQDIGPALDPGLMVVWTAGEAVRYDNEQRAAAAAAEPPMRSLGSAIMAPRATAPTPIDTRYRPDPAVRERDLAHFVERTRAVDPDTAAELEHSFATRDVIGEIAGALRKYGLDANDAADATTAYILTAWYGVRGRDDDPAPGEIRAVRAQIASAMAATPAFASASDAMRQELSEAMLIHTLLAGQAVTAVKNDPDKLAQVTDAIGRGARATFGFDLKQVGLGEHGLTPM